MMAPAELLRGLPPLLGERPRLLILGSMPGACSLRVGEYYAHPRNAFWPIMTRLFAVPAQAPYAERVAALLSRQIAVWDLIASCRRHGSLDTAIEAASIRTNDLAGLLRDQPSIRLIALNGGTAAREFARQMARSDPPYQPFCLRLPSTSPANARLSFAQKLAAWRAIVE